MSKIITYNFNQDFIAELADYICANFLKNGNDLSRVAVVFGGRRPRYFLRKALSQRIGSGYFPPAFFTIDNFMREVVSRKAPIRLAPAMDSCYIIYKAASQVAPSLLEDKPEFSQFLPWAKEVNSFIEELDLEDIPDERLKSDVEKSAEIGYEVPESINQLLSHIVAIRGLYHEGLRSRKLYSRGLMYLEASRLIPEAHFDEFDQVLFCNLYYLYKTEGSVVKHLFDNDLATLFFQKDGSQWPVLKELQGLFNAPIEPESKAVPKFTPHIYKGFDSHSQVGLVREIISKEIKKEELDKTLVLLPDANNLIPLLSEISSELPEFNVSMGYPLKRSSLFGLFQYIFEAQSRRRDNEYYSRDYLKVILHPIIKNLLIKESPAATRILCHKVEEALNGTIDTALAGSLFIKLEEIEKEGKFFQKTADSLTHQDIHLGEPELKEVISRIHRLCFSRWEEVNNFSGFIDALQEFTDAVLFESMAIKYRLNSKVIERIYGIIDELRSAEFRDQPFAREEIFRIFIGKLEDEKISFSGSPLKGLQVLGLLETRGLTFKNVIIMDANEGLLPRVKVYEPLIPRQVMESLGLKCLKEEEEVEKYHFSRLVGGAKDVYFVYDDDPEKEPSRFIEEIIWQKQKVDKKLSVFKETRARFNVNVAPQLKPSATKDQKVLDYLQNDFVFSPSSIDTYLKCPLEFYYQYVLRLREKEDMLGEPESKDVGIVVHDLFEAAFKDFVGKEPVIDKKFETNFWELFRELFDDKIRNRIGSEAFMIEGVLRHRLEAFLKRERQKENCRNVKKIISLEKNVQRQKTDFLGVPLYFSYRIDRVDELVDGSLLVIDYKTGSSAKVPNGTKSLQAMADAMTRQTICQAVKSFQLPVYYHFISEEFKDKPLNAALYMIQRPEKLEYFIKKRDLERPDRVMGFCLDALKFIINEIFDSETDFDSDDTGEACRYCPFGALCR
ncbi:MAG: PD-(D/E)XK nuclease family protein [Candidatus Omnitrophica bacterium]|nr:PD-(D/E)XK nuclease family protein [Candidatus Omnitrophota bacterium]